MLALSPGLRAQMAPKPGAEKAPPAPAPFHDLSGVWNMHSTPAQRKFINSTYTAEGPEMTEWAKEKYEAAKPSNGPRSNPLTVTDDPVLRKCFPPGTPRIYLQPFPMQIVQTPKEILMVFEYDHTIRQIFMDGRPHPDDLIPTYMGHSIGKWDGDTLVVDTVGFNTNTWLDRDGHQHSDQLHIIERFNRVDFDDMNIDITIMDPKALVKPWVSQLHYVLKPGWDIMELACPDNLKFESFEK
ncbi:MAG: hypothetical protein ACRD4Y_04750 [Candidatus Acidiferrales bacterium]